MIPQQRPSATWPAMYGAGTHSVLCFTGVMCSGLHKGCATILIFVTCISHASQHDGLISELHMYRTLGV